MDYEKRIRTSYNSEIKRVPLHLRGNDVSDMCIEHAVTIVEKSGIGQITSRAEQFVLVSKLRDMLHYAILKGSFDYQTLRIEPDDEERNGQQLYSALDYIARGVSDVYVRQVANTQFELTPEEVIPYCKSLLWLCNIAAVADVNKDLYDQYFGAAEKCPSKQ